MDEFTPEVREQIEAWRRTTAQIAHVSMENAHLRPAFLLMLTCELSDIIAGIFNEDLVLWEAKHPGVQHQMEVIDPPTGDGCVTAPMLYLRIVLEPFLTDEEKELLDDPLPGQQFWVIGVRDNEFEFSIYDFTEDGSSCVRVH
jgi:hypothetical protein